MKTNRPEDPIDMLYRMYTLPLKLTYPEARDLYSAVRKHRLLLRGKDYGAEYLHRIEALETRLSLHLNDLENRIGQALKPAQPDADSQP